MSKRDYTIEEIEAFYRLMGLEPGTLFDEVKKEYRFQSKAFHPDRFENGSSSQKRAHSKFIDLTEAYEAIQDFLKDHPDGSPQGGWPSSGRSTTNASETYSSASYSEPQKDEFVDWQQWRKAYQGGGTSTVSGTTQQVLDEWKKRQDEEQNRMKYGFTRSERSKFVFWGRILLVISALMLQTGHRQSNEAIIATKGPSMSQERKAAEKQYMQGFISEEVYKKRIADLEGEKNAINQKIDSTGMFSVFYFCFVIWVLLFPRPRKFIKNWVEGDANETSL